MGRTTFYSSKGVFIFDNLKLIARQNSSYRYSIIQSFMLFNSRTLFYSLNNVFADLKLFLQQNNYDINSHKIALSRLKFMRINQIDLSQFNTSKNLDLSFDVNFNPCLSGNLALQMLSK